MRCALSTEYNDFVINEQPVGTPDLFDSKGVEWFRSRREAKVIIEQWRQHYNLVRPHSSLKYRTPVEFRRHHDSINQGAILK